MKACEGNNSQLVRRLIDIGADVNKLDFSGASPLMWASYHGCLDTVKVLLDRGKVNLNQKNQGGMTALMLAKFNHHQAIVSLLQQAGAIE
jgi:ankyrin repeat protein